MDETIHQKESHSSNFNSLEASGIAEGTKNLPRSEKRDSLERMLKDVDKNLNPDLAKALSKEIAAMDDSAESSAVPTELLKKATIEAQTSEKVPSHGEALAALLNDPVELNRYLERYGASGLNDFAMGKDQPESKQ